MNKLLRLPPVLSILLALNACKTHSGSAVAVATLFQHSHCQAETAKAILIDNAADLSAWWQPLARLSLPARELPAPLAQVDWRERNVVVVYAGSRPSAGYKLELAGGTAQVEDQTLKINVHLTEPPADAMVAQVITSPCMVIAANKDSYTAVKVEEEGKIFPTKP